MTSAKDRMNKTNYSLDRQIQDRVAYRIKSDHTFEKPTQMNGLPDKFEKLNRLLRKRDKQSTISYRITAGRSTTKKNEILFHRSFSLDKVIL
jgi:hypothetical protein